MKRGRKSVEIALCTALEHNLYPGSSNIQLKLSIVRPLGTQKQILLGTILFLAGQFFSTAHAVEFGVTPHEHGGVVCVPIVNDDQDVLLPVASLVSRYSAQRAHAVAVPERPLLVSSVIFRPTSRDPPKA